jgi:exodeoxyribonuclease VII small subunit
MTDHTDAIGAAEAPDPGPEEPAVDDVVGYADAMSELDGILRELDDSDVDVDRLAERVARAADLIALCRNRIDRARLKIDDVIADLDGADD